MRVPISTLELRYINGTTVFKSKKWATIERSWRQKDGGRVPCIP